MRFLEVVFSVNVFHSELGVILRRVVNGLVAEDFFVADGVVNYLSGVFLNL
jgi:hypothetical protein